MKLAFTKGLLIVLVLNFSIISVLTLNNKPKNNKLDKNSSRKEYFY